MTTAELLSRVLSRLAPNADSEARADVSFAVTMAAKDALKELGHETAAGKNNLKRSLFTKDFTIAITAGVGSLATAKAASEPCIAEYADKGEWSFAGDTLKMQYVPDRATLSYDLRAPWRYFTITGDEVKVKNHDSSTTTGDVTASLPYIPLLSSVTSEAEGRLVEIVCGLVKVDGRVKDVPEAK